MTFVVQNMYNMSLFDICILITHILLSNESQWKLDFDPLQKVVCLCVML